MLVRLLYASIIRPHLEIAITVWNFHLKHDKEEIEKVLRAVKIDQINLKRNNILV